MIPAMVNVLEFEAGVSLGVVDSAVGSGAGLFSSITKTAVVRPGMLNVPFSQDALFTTSSVEFC